MHNKNHQHNNIRFVTGRDYDNPNGFQILYDMIKRQVDSTHPDQYDPQWLNWMIRLDQQRNGFTIGIEQNDQLQCLLVAEWQYNMWRNIREVNIVGILTAPRCANTLVDQMLERLELWAKQQDCESINIFTWDARKAYQRWCERKGFQLHQYTYTKELKR